MIVGANEINLSYCSTYYSLEYKAFGSQYDLLGDSIFTKYINCTGGYSNYCGSIEYRKAKNPVIFAFNEITQIHSKYIMSFCCHYDKNYNNIEMCNVINNTLKIFIKDNYNPSIIYYIENGLIIKRFIFFDNDYGEDGMISSSKSTSDYSIQNITFVDCFSSYNSKEKWINRYINTINCVFEYVSYKTFDINLFNLKDCVNAIPTKYFSETALFSESKDFTCSSSFEILITPNQTKKGFKTSNSICYSQSVTLVKSVSMSISLTLTDVASLTFIEELGEYSYIYVPSYIESNFHYIIQFLSRTYVESFVMLEIDIRKKKITPEKLIGIICGTVGCIFAIIGIVLFVIRKKYFNNISDSLDFSDDDEIERTKAGEGTENNETKTGKSSEITKETEVNYNISEINNGIDDWL